MAEKYLILDCGRDTVTFPVDLTVPKKLYLELQRLAQLHEVTVAELVSDACGASYTGSNKPLPPPSQVREDWLESL